MAYPINPTASPPRAFHVGSLFGTIIDIAFTPSLERPPYDYSKHELGGGEARDKEDAICSD
jgi:hypothetical protein